MRPSSSSSWLRSSSSRAAWARASSAALRLSASSFCLRSISATFACASASACLSCARLPGARATVAPRPGGAALLPRAAAIRPDAPARRVVPLRVAPGPAVPGDCFSAAASSRARCCSRFALAFAVLRLARFRICDESTTTAWMASCAGGACATWKSSVRPKTPANRTCSSSCPDQVRPVLLQELGHRDPPSALSAALLSSGSPDR